jgi:signal peptidase I
MRTTPYVHKLVPWALALAVLSLGWWFLAPAAIGGSATYVVTDGVSMQPRFHAGDLAIIRAQSSYHVGEIVGYRSEFLHTIVLHRIIAIKGDRYFFKGDNNSWVDAEHPFRSQLVGALWVHLPGFGKRLGPLRRPGSVVLAATFGLLLFASSIFTDNRRRRRRRRGNAGGGPRLPRIRVQAPSLRRRAPRVSDVRDILDEAPQPRVEPQRIPDAVRDILGDPPDPRSDAPPVVAAARAVASRLPSISLESPSGTAIGAAAASVLFALLMLATLAMPTQGKKAFHVEYAQSGEFAYSAAARPGAAYPSGRAGTGDPLFLRLVHQAEAGFTYRFSSGSPHRVGGTASLAAQLASTTGWTRTFVLEPSRPFTGDTVTVKGPLDLHSLATLLASLETATQVVSSYTLTLVPHVQVRGEAGGVPLSTSFAPQLGFSLDSNELEPTLPGSVGHPSTPDPANPIKPAASGSLTATRTHALSVAGVSIGTARTLTVGGLLAALGLLWFGLRTKRGQPRPSEADKIRTRYRSLLVPVNRVKEPTVDRVVDLLDMESLVRIAERYDRMILHELVGGRDVYSVADDGVMYRFETGSAQELGISAVLDRIGTGIAPKRPHRPGDELARRRSGARAAGERPRYRWG